MTERISASILSSLIGSIYDCALEPDRWEKTLDEIKVAGDFYTVVLGLVDKPSNRFLISQTRGMQEAWLQKFPPYFPEMTAFLARFLREAPDLDALFVLSRDLSRDEYRVSPYVQECLLPVGIVDILQLFFINTDHRWSGVGFGRHEDSGVVGEREIQFARLLLPHLRRAVTISNVLDARTIEAARMAEVLDTLSCGVVIADERCGVLHANRSAEEMLSDGTRVHATNGKLRASSPAASKELREAIQIAARNEAAIGKTGLAIRLGTDDARPVFAHVLPMAGSDVRTRLSPAAAAAVFIGAPANEADAAETMMAAYDLTPAETRVLASLLAGRTLSETAATLRIAATTAKTHLENIFGKTGATRQAELIRLVARVVPPARSI